MSANGDTNGKINRVRLSALSAVKVVEWARRHSDECKTKPLREIVDLVTADLGLMILPKMLGNILDEAGVEYIRKPNRVMRSSRIKNNTRDRLAALAQMIIWILDDLQMQPPEHMRARVELIRRKRLLSGYDEEPQNGES